MTNEHNDIQAHLIRQLRKAADDYRAVCRAKAETLIDTILDGHAAGMSRDDLIDNLTRGLVNGGLR